MIPRSIASSRRCRKLPQGGFSLIELSIVLIIAAIIIGVSLTEWQGTISGAQITQTKNKMDQIEKALMAFRRANNRLPCPADITAASGSAAYGVEKGNPGSCSGAAASDTTLPASAVEGGIPYVALNLPEQFMYDAWGNRIVYAVDPRMTETEAFSNYDIYGTTDSSNSWQGGGCGGIKVLDDTDNPRNANNPYSAVYALLSHGPNGHGGYNRNATQVSSGSTNADEQTNCHCSSTLSPLTYAADYVQKDMTGSGTNTFDDIVRYKERWQMQTESDTAHGFYLGPEAGFALQSSPYVQFYNQTCDSYPAITSTTTPAAPSSPVATSGNAIAVSPDDSYWALAYSSLGSSFVAIYQRNTSTGALSLLSGIPATQPSGNAYSVAFSPKDVYLAVGSDDSTSGCPSSCPAGHPVYLSLYTISGGTFSYVGNVDSTLTSKVTATAFAPNDGYLAAGYAVSPYLSVYAHGTGNAFTSTSVTAPGSAVKAVAFSNDNRYMAVGVTSSPYLYVYNVSSFNTSGISFSGSTLGASVTGVSFSPDNRYLAASTASGTFVYRIDPAASTFTQIYAGSDDANAAAFSPREHVLAEALAASPYAAIIKYIPIVESFTGLANGSAQGFYAQPGGAATGVAMRYPD